MTLVQWFLFFLLVQVIHFAGTWKLYVKAGRKAWEAAIPVYNAVILTKIINRHWSWVILLFIPVINVIMLPIIWVETIRSFGRNSNLDTALVLLTLGFYTYYINYTQDVNYIENRDLKPRTVAGEWVSSILFAVVAATIVHTYFMQPYNIPTSSLEKTLLVGDFLFVSKFHYGARTPMTAVSLPMVHDSIPKTKLPSYLKKPQLPYFRLPGFQDVKRSDIVVFSWPVDTVTHFFAQNGIHVDKPIDKKSNYVKRCVGLPGDNLSIIDGKVHINGEQIKLPQKAKPQYSYKVTGNGGNFSPKTLYKYFDYTEPLRYFDPIHPNKNELLMTFTDETAKKFEASHKSVQSIEKNIMPKGVMETKPVARDAHGHLIYNNKVIFPNNGKVNWNRDQMGPFYIPEAEKTIKITQDNIDLYKRVIEVYEGSEMGIDNEITFNGSTILLNGNPLTEYTFKQNYYWLMGDNRHNSEDSRYWGFVPENHIVGKPVFLFMSIDQNVPWTDIKNKIRWDRLMTTVGGDGELKSYKFIVFLIILAYIGYEVYRSRKKQKA